MRKWLVLLSIIGLFGFVSNAQIKLDPNPVTSADVSGLQTQIDANATSITTNATNITANTTSITNITPTWVDVAFNAGDFTGEDMMTWTVDEADVVFFKYVIVGEQMTVAWRINNTTVGGTPSAGLDIAMPGSVTLSGDNEANPIHLSNNGTNAIGFALLGTNVIRLILVNIGTWSASTNDTDVQGQITFEIVP